MTCIIINTLGIINIIIVTIISGISHIIIILASTISFIIGIIIVIVIISMICIISMNTLMVHGAFPEPSQLWYRYLPSPRPWRLCAPQLSAQGGRAQVSLQYGG